MRLQRKPANLMPLGNTFAVRTRKLKSWRHVAHKPPLVSLHSYTRATTTLAACDNQHFLYFRKVVYSHGQCPTRALQATHVGVRASCKRMYPINRYILLYKTILLYV